MKPEEDARREVMWAAFSDAAEESFTLPGFEVEHELARGGMAIVYLAKQEQPEREVALKVVLPKFLGDEEVRARFQQEGRAMAALEHPGVLPIYQVGEWDGLAYLTMKLVRGGSLLEVLQRGLPEVRAAVDWLIAAGEAVHFAHQRGVLHRDLKPGNLLFDEEGAIYVGDFGVAKLDFAEDGGLTRTQSFVGTPNYLAPEVASGETSAGSVAADLYGLGAVLYECLTGRRPHNEAENLAAQLRSVVNDEIGPARKLRADLPRDLEVICAKALAKAPRERYSSVADFVEDLQRWRDGRVILARPARFPEKVWRWAKRHPLPAALSALFLGTLILGTVLLVENYHRRGELLQESLIERARAESLVRDAGFRERALSLLGEARELGAESRIREEAIVALTGWDAGAEASEPAAQLGDDDPRGEASDEEVSSQRQQAEQWLLEGGVLRCEPAWSQDGRFLAVVQGERMEVVVYEMSQRKVFSRILVRDWPERIAFDAAGECLQVFFEDETALFANVQGRVLLRKFEAGRALLPPVGFSTWRGQVLSPSEGRPYGGSLSPDEKFLLTISFSGLQLWDVAQGRSVSFYETENQRIDAPTDAWWLDEGTLLFQVPGSLEKLTLDAEGQFLEAKPLKREPGTRVEEVLLNGDWVVEVRDEDGEKSQVLWPQGDSAASQAFERERPRETELDAADEQRIYYQDWCLSLPPGEKVKQAFVHEQGSRVIVLTQSYTLYEWDLTSLANELEKRGF